MLMKHMSSVSDQKITVEKGLYKAGIAAILVMAAFAVLCFIFPAIPDWLMTRECLVRELTGWYCPGCGGTRAVAALLRGDILMSLYYHPIVIYAVVLFAVFMVTQTLEILTHDKVTGMKYRDAYIYIGLVIIAVNWIVKNVLLYMGHPMV